MIQYVLARPTCAAPRLSAAGLVVLERLGAKTIGRGRKDSVAIVSFVQETGFIAVTKIIRDFDGRNRF